MPGITKNEFFFPRTSDKNKWADYFEILCLINENETISLDSIVDRISDEMAGDSEQAFAIIEGLGQIEIEFDDSSDETETEEGTLILGSSKGDNTDKLKRKIKEYIEFLFYRIKIYKDFYPFSFVKKHGHFKLKRKLTPSQKLYLSLLISANLDYADTYISNLTKEFERLSLKTCKKILTNCKVHYFGANGIVTSRYSGNLFSKFQKLSGDINLPLSAYATASHINAHNSGDKGLDIVGWYPFSDKQPGTFLYFAQCACGQNWLDKAIEAHHITWERVFQFFNKPVTILLSPVSYRKPLGHWFNPFEVHQDFILIDRLRLLQSLPTSKMNEAFKPYKKIMNEIIQNKKNYFD